MKQEIKKKDMSFLNYAPTPPRGWNSWDCYGASVTEDEVKANADFIAKYLKPHGWNYVVVDIQWYEPTADSSRYHDFASIYMDEYSRLIPAENRFPTSAGGKGFGPLAEYVHELGLKFGIHIMRGIPRQAVCGKTALKGTDYTADKIAVNNICPWNTDMYGVNTDLYEGQLYYDSIIELYASWGVDFLKVDDIASSKLFECHKGEIEAIREAIDKTNREIVLSLSPGPAKVENGAFLQQHSNMWRLTDDFWDIWDYLVDMFDRCEKWAPFVRKGNWIDCDMLPMGHLAIRSEETGATERISRFSQGEQRMMMTLWTIVQSPLFYGGDFINCNPDTLDLLINDEVISMHDNLDGAKQLYRDEKKIIWQGQAANTLYYAVFNLSTESIVVDVSCLKETTQYFYDLWKKSNVDAELIIPSHDARLLKVM